MRKCVFGFICYIPVTICCFSQSTQIFQGLTNTSLGKATMVIACCVSNLGSSGQDGLTISNLGSSGQDGVSIAIGTQPDGARGGV